MKSFFILVSAFCLIVLIATAVDFIDNKNVLLELSIKEKELSIQLLKLSIQLLR